MTLQLPQLLVQPADVYAWTRTEQRHGHSVAVVPTMGALHDGHLSLVRRAAEACQRVVVTIFVNPTQFGPHEDFERYPRSLESDLERLSEVRVDCVFAPPVEAMYPPGCTTAVKPPRVADTLEGECRPGHFEGVCTIVLKLLQMIPADRALFGQKDYQQALVITHMLRDLHVSTEVQVCATVREHDGLAMSSRNAYLSQQERERALSLDRSLKRLGLELESGQRSVDALQMAMCEELAPFVEGLDYAVVADPETLKCPAIVEGPIVGLIAAHVGSTRLIDNRRFDQKGRCLDKI